MLYEWALIAILFTDMLDQVHPVHQEVVLVGMHSTESDCKTVAAALNRTDEWPYYMECYRRD